MIAITLSPEQLAAAPPEVRRWAEGQLAATLGFIGKSGRAGAEVETGGLTEISPAEALRIFQLLQNDFLAGQLYLEFGREALHGEAIPPFYAFSLADILGHTRLGNSDRLLACLEKINMALRQVAGSPQATLFGFDGRGNIFIRAATHASIARVWQQLVTAEAEVPAQQVPVAPNGFAAPPVTATLQTEPDAPSPAAYGVEQRNVMR